MLSGSACQELCAVRQRFLRCVCCLAALAALSLPMDACCTRAQTETRGTSFAASASGERQRAPTLVNRAHGFPGKTLCAHMPSHVVSTSGLCILLYNRQKKPVLAIPSSGIILRDTCKLVFLCTMHIKGQANPFMRNM